MNEFPVKVKIDDSEIRAAMARHRAVLEAEVLPDRRRLVWLGEDPERLEDVRGIMLNEDVDIRTAVDIGRQNEKTESVAVRGAAVMPPEHVWWQETAAELAAAADALLARLPRCHACDRPATRVFMGPDVAIPSAYAVERGKRFVPRPYLGPSIGAHLYVAPDGTWQWDVCEDNAHAMPGAQRSWDNDLAKTIRTIERLGAL